MKFIQTFTSGGADHDPRQITNARFHCDNCDSPVIINITHEKYTFDPTKQRKCTECGQYSKKAYIENIKNEVERLVKKLESKDANDIIEKLKETIS